MSTALGISAVTAVLEKMLWTVFHGGSGSLNLGPIGNAYLASPARPIGLTITVGGLGTAA